MFWGFFEANTDQVFGCIFRCSLLYHIDSMYTLFLLVSLVSAVSSISVSLTNVPAYGTCNGSVTGVVSDFAGYGTIKAALYLYTGLWYSKPDFGETVSVSSTTGQFTFTSSDWCTDSEYDSDAHIVAVYIFLNSVTAPSAGENDDDFVMPPAVEEDSLCGVWVGRGTLTFAGYDLWQVKDTVDEGPGPNDWSANSQDVFSDSEGMHLSIVKRSGTWYSTEVWLLKPLGYGTYSFQVNATVNSFDKDIVLGLFTWDDTGEAVAYREIDFEFSRWDEASDSTNSQVVRLPYLCTTFTSLLYNHLMLLITYNGGLRLLMQQI